MANTPKQVEDTMGFPRKGNREQAPPTPKPEHQPPADCEELKSEIAKLKAALEQDESDFRRTSAVAIETKIVADTRQLTAEKDAGRGGSAKAKKLENEIAGLKKQLEADQQSEPGKSSKALADDISRLNKLLSDKQKEFQDRGCH